MICKLCVVCVCDIPTELLCCSPYVCYLVQERTGGRLACLVADFTWCVVLRVLLLSCNKRPCADACVMCVSDIVEIPEFIMFFFWL